MPSPSPTISVAEFVRETWDDYNSPTTSNFVSRMGRCRTTVGELEEILDNDRSGLMKMKKSTKALYSSGTMHVSHETYLAENLKKMGVNALTNETEADIGAAFLKFSVVTKELTALMKNLMQSINNILMFPLDSFLKGDLRGVKGDMKKPFDKSWKEYESKFSKLEKEKKQLAKEAGMIKTELVGSEIAEEMEKERRMFQLQMCEYLMKVNEIKTKKGVDLLQHLVEYYQAQANYFCDGLKTINHFKCYIDDLVAQLADIRRRQDDEKHRLTELKEALRSTMTPSDKEVAGSAAGGVYSLHQLVGRKEHGCERTGTLMKKSDGKMRRVWQRRRCAIRDGILSIGHSDTSKEPVKLNLLTCQVKLVMGDAGRMCFDLISSSKNRTYHFQAEDKQNMEEWISVLTNAKESVLLKAFGESANSESSPINQSIRELTTTIIGQLKRLPGNRSCCDCGAPDPEWLSVNLGVLICLECCGVHRLMGVHISRTQSVVIDDLGTSQLLLASVVSNRGFNDIMEATLDVAIKPTPTSNMEARKTFIRSKYEKRTYALVTCPDPEDRREDLQQAIMARDIASLLQVYAEGIDFMLPLPDTDNDETALHLAILEEDGTSLHMVDFIIQNSNSQHLARTTRDGCTCLHLCARLNRTECMKLLLRLRPDLVDLENGDGQTALEIARERDHAVCVELINHALSGKTDLYENVNIDWNLIQEEPLYDNIDGSDDELDTLLTPDRKMRSRPVSLVLSGDPVAPPGGAQQVAPPAAAAAAVAAAVKMSRRERSKTVDSFKVPLGMSLNNARAKTITLPISMAVASQNTSTPPNPGGGGGGGATTMPATFPRKKAPAPPPPPHLATHCRQTSDPGVLNAAVVAVDDDPSRPPPLPVKSTTHHRPAIPCPGAKLVLPPPAEFRTVDHRRLSLSLAAQKALFTASESLFGTKRTTDHDKNGSQSKSSKANEKTAKAETSHDKAPKVTSALQRCRALYDCDADNDDELSFKTGEVILLLKEEEEDQWWEGEIEGNPLRRGMFPATFVEVIR